MRLRPRQLPALVFGLLVLSSSACNFTEDLDALKDEVISDRLENNSDLCLTYCDLSAEACVGNNALYDDDNACLARCANLNDTGIDDERSGDTVQCRIWHLETAMRLEPTIHCKHGSQDGGGQCVGVSPCGNYCAFLQENCGQFNFFESDTFSQDCTTTCVGYSLLGKNGDTTGDSFQCRNRAVLQAVDDPAQFCPQAGPDGGAVCAGPPLTE